MAFHWFLFPTAIVLLPVVPVFADDRTALAQRIEEIGSTSSHDSWPMSDRENPQYLSMVSQGENNRGLKTTWEQIDLKDCILTITGGFWATGKSLPMRRIDFSLADASVSFALAPQNGDGVSGVRITFNNPDQTIAVIQGSEDFSGWEESEAGIKRQVFVTRPAPGYLLSVHYPEDRAPTAPELLRAVDDYRAQYCATNS